MALPGYYDPFAAIRLFFDWIPWSRLPHNISDQRRFQIAENYQAKRKHVDRYITDSSPPRRGPLGSHWKKLRARLRRNPADTDRRARELYSLVHTGWYWVQSDEREAENRRRATDALPSGRQAKALTEDWTRWAKGDLAHLATAEQAGVLRQRVHEPTFEAADGTEMRAIFTAKDLMADEQGRSNLQPGSRRLKEWDTASEELMEFLVNGLELPAHAAALLTADVNLWFWGRLVAPDALRWRWTHQTRR